MTTQIEREAIRERLELLAKRNGGRLTPEIVVEDAKAADSPLHEHFTWDVKRAAYQFWLEQARTLITSVRVDVRTEHRVVSTVAFVRDPSVGGKTQGYVAVERLRTDKELAREALVGEFTRVGDMLRRAREIAAALDAANEVEDLIERVTGLRMRFMEPPAQQQ